MKLLSIRLEPDLYALIQSRASFNHRSMSREVTFLIEAALGAESEGNLQIIRTLFMAQGGIESVTSQD